MEALIYLVLMAISYLGVMYFGIRKAIVHTKALWEMQTNLFVMSFYLANIFAYWLPDHERHSEMSERLEKSRKYIVGFTISMVVFYVTAYLFVSG